MLMDLRDLAPAGLVPAAWAATALAHADLLDADGMLVAHLVMAVFIAFFTVTGWNAMATGALRAWRTVLLVGFALTLAGIAGFLGPAFESALLATSLLGWMLLPAAGLAYTGGELREARLVYYAGAGLSVFGAALYVVALAVDAGTLVYVALGCVGVGQTAGIVDASLRS